MTFLGSKTYTKIALGLSLLLLGLNSCKPEEEPFDNQIGNPVFSLKGTIDGEPLQLIAGVNDYYMFTDYELPQNDSVYRFTGRLEKANCQNCDESLEIVLGNSSPVSGAIPFDIDKAMGSTFTFANKSAVLGKNYTIQLFAENSGFVNPRYLWSFGSALDTSMLPNPVVTFRDSFPKNICLTISDTGCNSTICNVFNPFLVDFGDSVPPSFDYTVGPTVIFRNFSFGGVSYLWDFGDGSGSSSFEPEHVYLFPGVYKVCLTVNTPINRHTYCRNIVVNLPNFGCIANMRYGPPAVTQLKEDFLAKTIVRFTAKNGNVYESDIQQQPTTSFFTINNHQNYLPNENGQKTRQLDISFKCRLFNPNDRTDFKDIEINNSTIAIAHP